MRQTILFVTISISICVLAETVRCEEIDGIVLEVMADTVQIATTGDLLPVVGDQVVIAVRIPGLAGVATVGSGEVTKIEGDAIIAKINRATATLRKGQLAKITSARPIRRSQPPGPVPPDEPPLPTPDEPRPGQRHDEPDSQPRSAPANSRQIVKAVVELLPRMHLSRHPVDDEIGRRMMQLLIDQLDERKYYFTTADIERFRRREDVLASQLREGDLSTAFELFNVYLHRVAERLEAVELLLEADHDFTVDEILVTDPSKIDFPANEQEAGELWRKRVKYQLLTHLAAGEDLGAARRQARKVFTNLQRQIGSWTDEDLMEYALSALAAAYDPHSTYISPRKYEDFVIQQRQQLFGIGASLQVVDGYVRVTQVVPGGPAQRDGRLKAGDRIVAVGEGESGEMTDVVGTRLQDVVSLIRGTDGSTVRLLVLPEGQFESKMYPIRRGKVEIVGIDSTIIDADQLPAGRTGKIGYVRLSSFYGSFRDSQSSNNNFSARSSSNDMREILEEFANDAVDMVVLDLRNNGGGSLNEALNVAGLFLGNVNLVQVSDAQGNVQVYVAPDVTQIAWSGPLVVSVNALTSGGSEIVVGALQDYRRALVVGDERTHGFGTVQNVDDIGRRLFNIDQPPSLGYLKVTTQRFYRPSGQSTQIRGVTSDVVLPSFTHHMDVRESNLPYAMDTDTIAAATFQPTDFGLDAELLKQLAERSAARRGDTPYFQQLAEQIEAYLARKARGGVSLQKQQFFDAQRSQQAENAAAATLDTADISLDGHLHEALAVTLDYLGRRSFMKAEQEFQGKRFADAISFYNAAVDADPDYPVAHYKLSWLLATCEQIQHRDGRLAVEHAQRACQLDGYTQWHYLLALAIAEARAGDFDNAQQHLKTALEKAPEPQRPRYRFLEQRFQNRQAYP